MTRKKVIEILSENKEYSIEESAITPFEIQKADEVFMTNSITGIQSITHYRKKEFATEITQKIKASLKLKEITGK